MRDLAVESAVIPGRAVTLLLRHLPQLVTVICLGLAGRQAVIWCAVWLSTFSSLAASLVMPLAPLSVMVSLIFCLWLLRPSLPFLSATFPDRDETSSRLRLMSVGGLLISFLTVYSTHGMLKEDLAAFRRAATLDEFQNQGFEADFSRAFVMDTWTIVGLIVVTIVLRKIIGYFALAEKGLGFSYLSAYLEVLWMSMVSVVLTNQLTSIQDWALSRRSMAPAYRSYVDMKTNLEETAGPFMDAWTWLAEKLPALNQFITVPIAWLTLGAVVFGTSIAAKKAADQEQSEKEAEEAADKAAAEAGSAAAEQPRESARVRVRKRVRSTAEQEAKNAFDNALQPVAGPLKSTWNGLRTLARAGLVPMTIFCLIFIFATGIELGVVELGRAIAGPQQHLLSETAATYILIVARAVYLIVVACLIASALDFFLRNTYSPAAEPAGAGAAGAGAAGAGAADAGAGAAGAGAESTASMNSAGSGSTTVT